MDNNELLISQIQNLNGIQSIAFKKIGSYLGTGDRVPSMVSGIIWQPAQEIATTLVESVAHDELIAIRKSELMEKLEGMKELYVEQLIINTLDGVYTALFSEVSPMNRYTNRLGLMRKSIQELDEYNQNRVLAINLRLPYYSYIVLINIFTLYPELIEIFLAHQGEIRTLSNGSILLKVSKKDGETEESLPYIPGTIVEKISPTDYCDIQEGIIKITFGGGYAQSITIPPHIIKFYETLLSKPADRQKIRNMIIEKGGDDSVWKNLFGKRGGKNHEERTIDGKPIFEGY